MSGTILDVRLRMAVNFPPLPQVASSNLILDLRSKNIVGVPNGSLLSSWPDASVNSFNFTSSGTFRPTFVSSSPSGSYPYVSFAHGGNQSMDGQNWAALDNLNSFSVFLVHEFPLPTPPGFYPAVLQKYDVNSGAGWDTELDYFMQASQDYSNFNQIFQVPGGSPFTYGTKHIIVTSKFPDQTLNMFVDGQTAGILGLNGTVTQFSTSQIVQLGTSFSDVDYSGFHLYAALVYSPVPNKYDRKLVEWWLSDQYNIPLQG